MKEYIIVGNTTQYQNCLIAVCGVSKAYANDCLKQYQINPEYKDYTNIHIEETDINDSWWKYEYD